MSSKKILSSKKAPAPIGPYSQAVEAEMRDTVIFTSGQVGLDASGNLVSDDIKEQTKQTFENLKNILEDNGSSLDNVIKATVFLKDMKDFSPMNEIYAEYFKNFFPARSTIAVAGLPKDAKVEIELISFKK